MPAATVVAVRLKREDCPRTKHDALFSPWKVRARSPLLLCHLLLAAAAVASFPNWNVVDEIRPVASFRAFRHAFQILGSKLESLGF